MSDSLARQHSTPHCLPALLTFSVADPTSGLYRQTTIASLSSLIRNNTWYLHELGILAYIDITNIQIHT